MIKTNSHAQHALEIALLLSFVIIIFSADYFLRMYLLEHHFLSTASIKMRYGDLSTLQQ